MGRTSRRETLLSGAHGHIVIVSNNPLLVTQIANAVPEFTFETLRCGADLDSSAKDVLYLIDASQHAFDNPSGNYPLVVLSNETDAARLTDWLAAGVLDVIPPAVIYAPHELRQRLVLSWSRRQATSISTGAFRTATSLRHLFSAVCENSGIGATLFAELQQMQARSGAIYYYERTVLILQDHFGHAPEDLPFLQSIPSTSATITARAALRKEPLWRQSLLPGVDSPGCEAALPLLIADELIGIVHACFDVDLSMSDREALKQLAALAAGPFACERKLAVGQKEKRHSQQLLGMASHDLRNVLHVVSLSLQVFEHQPQANAKLLKRTTKSVEQALSIVDTLMDYTRVEMGDGIPISPEEVRLDRLLGSVIENVRLSARAREFHVEHYGDLTGVWDAARLTQIFTNLLQNADKYSAQEQPINVTLDGRRDPLYVTVANRGTPIPTLLLHRLFEPMVRATDRKAKTSGLGLGLYIVDNLVKAHGGRIWVRSDEETGTVFTVELPRSSNVATAGTHGKKATVLTAIGEMATMTAHQRGNDPLSPPPDVQDPICRDLYSVWLTLRGTKALPHLALLPRERVAGFLQDMAFIRIEESNRDIMFEFVEVGGALEQRLGRTLSGLRFIQSQVQDELSEFLAAYARAYHTRMPDFTYLVYRFPELPPARFERLVLPFSSRRDGIVTDVVSVARFIDFPGHDPA